MDDLSWAASEGDWLGRLLFQRGLAALYVLAFLGTALQGRALLGERGILPVARFVGRVPFGRAPSLFHVWSSDRALATVAWTGVVVSAALLAGGGDVVPLGASIALWLVPWALYLSIVNVGQRWYAFGWEMLLLEAGFLAAFLGPADTAPPVLVLWLLRWLLLRVELGAGLIKWRGDPCWRSLTCLRYHHETQPLPGPLSWWFHHLPEPLHRVEVAANHLTQLVVPVFLLAPQPIAGVAAALMVVTQLWLVASGNFAWLNALTIVIALPTLGGWLLGPLVPIEPPTELAAPPVWFTLVVAAVTLLVALLSLRVVRNLVAPKGRQRMNASFDPLRLVNTYGAFGSVTKVRREVILEGTHGPLGPGATWQEYGFRAKPGDPMRRPRQVAPYHLRLDWLMWFAALAPSQHEGWLVPLMVRLLRANPDVRRLIGRDPFGDTPPRWVRARVEEYRFTTRAERRATGAWWVRTPVGVAVGPLRLRDIEPPDPTGVSFRRRSVPRDAAPEPRRAVSGRGAHLSVRVRGRPGGAPGPRGWGRPDSGAVGAPRRALVALAGMALVAALGAGCGGDDGGEDSADTVASSTSAPTTESATTTEETTTTRPRSEHVIDVDVDAGLAGLIPPYPGEATYSTDSRWDLRQCDGDDAVSYPDAQAEATFVADEVTTVGLYAFSDGSELPFLQDYTDALLACAGLGPDEYDDVINLGQLAYGVRFRTETSDAYVVAVLAGNAVWVFQQQSDDGPVEVTESELQTLATAIG